MQNYNIERNEDMIDTIDLNLDIIPLIKSHLPLH